eukprot:513321-Rhodomonas_salina.1
MVQPETYVSTEHGTDLSTGRGIARDLCQYRTWHSNGIKHDMRKLGQYRTWHSNSIAPICRYQTSYTARYRLKLAASRSFRCQNRTHSRKSNTLLVHFAGRFGVLANDFIGCVNPYAFTERVQTPMRFNSHALLLIRLP